MEIDKNNYIDIRLSLYIHKLIINFLINNRSKNKFYLVCKFWFNIIQKLYNNINFVFLNGEIQNVVKINSEQVILLNEYQLFQKLNNGYSIYRFNNINQLKIEFNDIKEQYLLKFILSNFNNLNKIIFKCECDSIKYLGHLKIVYNIVKYLNENYNENFEIEIELYNNGNLEFNTLDLQDIYSLENYNNIKNVTLTSINNVVESNKINFIHFITKVMKLWKVTSLTINNVIDQEDFELFHIDYEFLVNNNNLKFLNLMGDFINLTTINKILRNNKNIEGLDIAIDYSLLLSDNQDHHCQLLSHDLNLLVYNSGQDWSEFCNLILNHQSLNGLILRNICKNKSIFNFSSNNDDVTSIQEIDSYKEDILVSHFTSIFNNQKLKVIGIDNFTKHFVSNTLNSINNNHNNIKTILILSILDKSEKEIQDTYNQLSFIHAIKNIFTTDKTIIKDKESFFGILLELLKKNRNIKKIVYNNNTFTLRQQTIIELLCKKENIKNLSLYEYDNQRYFYNLENQDLKTK